VIAFARIIQSESAQETSQSKMDKQTVEYQNKPPGAAAQTDHTGGLDCLRRRLSFVLTGTHLPVFDNYLKC